MAFDVTPTSGTPPYEFTAEFLNKESFNYGYGLRFWRTDPQAGTCPLPDAVTTDLPSAAASILSNGLYTRSAIVSPDVCQTFVLEIRDKLGNVIDSQSVNIDNI